jgi:hypothetical protein
VTSMWAKLFCVSLLTHVGHAVSVKSNVEVRRRVKDVQYFLSFYELFRIRELPQMLVAADIESSACECGRALDRFP